METKAKALIKIMSDATLSYSDIYNLAFWVHYLAIAPVRDTILDFCESYVAEYKKGLQK